MPLFEDAKRLIEKATGLRRPLPEQVEIGSASREEFKFADDGETPNNPRFPLLIYRSAVTLDPAFDPAAIFEVLFRSNGWEDSWRDGIYDFLHFHTQSHEVLGIARGSATVELGGRSGRQTRIAAGDVIVLPAGTGHRCIEASEDFIVVGAYPKGSSYDQPRAGEVDPIKARDDIKNVPAPLRDPVFGEAGPLSERWRNGP